LHVWKTELDENDLKRLYSMFPFSFFLFPTPLSGNAHVHNAAMSFRVHHYVGSWESFRLRGEKLFKERNKLDLVHHSAVVDNTTPQYSSPENLTWLSQFVKLVGKEKALDLTQRIRLHEVWELEKNFLKLKFKE